WYSCTVAHLRFFFFFKQKTAYEMVSDWSSDVCSSDLPIGAADSSTSPHKDALLSAAPMGGGFRLVPIIPLELEDAVTLVAAEPRSEERRVGKEGRSRGAAGQ